MCSQTFSAVMHSRDTFSFTLLQYSFVSVVKSCTTDIHASLTVVRDACRGEGEQERAGEREKRGEKVIHNSIHTLSPIFVRPNHTCLTSCPHSFPPLQTVDSS